KRIEKYNKIIQKEVTPDLDIRVRGSSKATKEVLESFELEGDEWEDIGESIDENIKNEDKIALAAKISNKIKGLCEALSALDPLEYSKLCKTDDDAPEWQKKLDEKLTEEQKKEAKNFGKIMSECFKTSGKECKCEEIPFPEFAETCSIAAPLATACDIKGDEEACDRLDNLDMPELPDHLQDVMDELEDIAEERYDMHMPKECAEAGATTKEECTKIMINKRSPKCAEKGITDPEECKRFMNSFRNDDFIVNFDCKNIEDPIERLDCFDKASEQTKDYHDNYEDIKKRERECAEECSAKQGRWDFTGGECKCYFDTDIWDDKGGWHGYDCSLIECSTGKHCEPDYGCVDDKIEEKPDDTEGERKEDCDDDEVHMCDGNECFCTSDPNDGCGAVDCEQGYTCQYGKCFSDGGGCGDCESKCPGASRTDCVDDECECYYEDDDQNPDDDSSEGCGDCESECPEKSGELLSGTDCVDDQCECYYRTESECKDGCEQECGDENTDCVDDKCVCLGYGENGPPTDDDEPEPEPNSTG
ncbi:MAG: hypothetical protein V3V78_04290, partial [Candidatus Woesearchaeota archaeon]